MGAIKRYRKHIRYNRRAGFLYLFLAILIGSMSIGYAYLSQGLSIEGRTALRNATWNVHLDNVQEVSGSVVATSAPEIEDDVSVHFSANLVNPGEFYAFTVDIVNEGSIDAMVESFSILPELSEEQSTYLTYNITYADGSPITEKQILEGHSIETLKVSFEYLDGVDLTYYPSENQNLSISFSIHYEQADETSEPVRFSDDDWTTIISNVREGTIPASYRLGSTHEVDLGTLGKHTVRIVNNSTPSVCGGTGFSESGCGFVLEFVDNLSDRVMKTNNSNAGGWPGTDMNSYLSNIVYNSFPTDLKNGVLDTSVVSGHGVFNASNFTSSNKVYLLSRCEVFEYSGTADSACTNTRLLDYYANGGSKVKSQNGSAFGWWLRSTDAESTNTFDSVNASGECESTLASQNLGTIPAFRIG